LFFWPGSHLQSSGQAEENNMESEGLDEVFLFRLLIEFGFYLGAFILPFLYITIALVKNTLLAALWINTSIALLILW